VNGPDDSVDAGEELLGQPAPSGRRRLAFGFAALLLVGGVITGLVTRGDGGHHVAQPSPGPSAAHSPSTVSEPGTSTTVSGPIVRTVALPDVGPVQLFVRAANAVVHLDFAGGTVTTTAVPALLSTGPVTFGVTETGAFVRPIDAVPGYFVPDGGAARELTGVLANAAVLPGPDSESVWIPEFSHNRLRGVREVYVPTSAVTSRFLPIPARVGRLWGNPQPDGSGYVLVSGEHGTFDLRPGGARRLPDALLHGTVLASGDDRLLVASCLSPRLQRCPVSLVHLSDGRLSRAGRALAVSGLMAGVIAPDARSALIYQPSTPGQLTARLFDLGTGRVLGAPVPVDPDVQPGSAVYSADGRWAFLAGVSGTLVAVNARTGDARRVEAGLPVVYQLAVRG
jgi:hypothetical protein